MKRALLVGINYRNSDAELSGCINDVTNVRDKILLARGYSPENITMLTDDTPVKPTRANILRALLELILSDSTEMYFHYSGHGTQVDDENNDEEDSLDEAICPLDYEQSGMILDDELHGLFNILRADQKILCVMDCCHSGREGMDLAYCLYERWNGDLQLFKDNIHSETRGRCMMLSGSRADQTSADAYIAGEYQGAMTSCLLRALGNDLVKTYSDLVKSVRKYLAEGKYSQVPQFSSGRRMSMREKISI